MGLRSQFALDNAFALAAGAAQALTNVFIAPIAGQLSHLVSGNLDASGWVITGTASIALAAIDIGVIALAQLALCKGTASAVIPLQQLPIQTIPIILHVLLYRGNFGDAPRIIMLAMGLVHLLTGSYVLGLGKKVMKAGCSPLRLAWPYCPRWRFPLASTPRMRAL